MQYAIHRLVRGGSGSFFLVVLFLVASIAFIVYVSMRSGTQEKARTPGGGAEEIVGQLDIVTKDTFDGKQHEDDYFLKINGGRNWYRLEFKEGPFIWLKSGDRVRVRGKINGRNFQVEGLELDKGNQESSWLFPKTPSKVEIAHAGSIDMRNAVTLLVRLNGLSPVLTKDDEMSNLFSSNDGIHSVDGLYKAISLGKTRFFFDADGNGKPDMFGPFTINTDSNSSTCDYYEWGLAAESAAFSAGIDLSIYQHKIIVFPDANALPSVCSGLFALGQAGCEDDCRVWLFNKNITPIIMAHELGHNLWLQHAAVDPDNDGIINTGDYYNDLSDIMGRSIAWNGFNAPHIDQMGWYSDIPGAIATVSTPGTHSFTLSPLENFPMQSGIPSILKIDE